MAIVLSGSLILSGSIEATGGVTISGSIASASYASTGSYSFNALTSSNALTASSADTLYVRNNLTALGTITAQTLNVQQVTSSVQFITGSTKFGSLQANTHEFTGSFGVTGSASFMGANVGIGTTTPGDSRLQISGTHPSGNAILRIQAVSTDTVTIGLFGTAGTRKGLFYYDSSRVGINSLSDPIIFEPGDVEKVRITTAGNVGIGTNSPLAATGYTSISVNNASNGGIIDLQTNGTSVARLGNNGTSLAFLETRTATPLYISTNDTTRIVVSSGGDVYVGGATSLPGAGSATTGVGMTPSGALTAQRNAATVGFFGRGTNDGELFAFYRGTSQVGAISVSTTGTSFTSTSNGGLTVLNSNGNVGIGASSAPVYKLEVSTSSGSQRIRVGTLQNNNNTATFEAITSSDISTATAGWIRANYGGGLAIGTSTYAKTGGDSGNFANLSSEAASTAITVNGGQTGIGGALPKSVLGSSSKLCVNGGATIGANGTSNTSALNLDIAIDAIDGGLTLLFLASRNTADGTSTASAVYIISFYYNGSNFPTISYLGGTNNFVSFGSSGGKLTATNSAGGNVNYSWFASK